jgi:hypothetical protein
MISMPRPTMMRWLLLPALLVALAAAGCGGDGDGGGSGGGSGDGSLQTAQAKADIDEFCAVADSGSNDLSDRAFFAMVDSVKRMIAAYRDDPGAQVTLVPGQPAQSIEEVMTGAAKDLKECGRDGKDQAALIETTLKEKSGAQ